jgi:hypothetical protein
MCIISFSDVNAASVKLNAKSKTITVKSTYTLKLSKVKASKVKWSSSDKAVATVSKKGKVTAKKVGTATVTATYKKKNYTCKITVNYPSYTVKASTKPYGGKYKKSSLYTSKTRQYFMIRSYLEKMESNGGGTLTLKKGTYTITNTLYVPSNVTIVFQNGVKIIKGTSTGTKGMEPSHTIFQLVEPSVGKKTKTAYNGVHDVVFRGSGSVTFDMQSYSKSIAIVAGHNKNVSISGITFKNMSHEAHFIELNSSFNVMVKNCTFDAGTQNKSDLKECINIDYDYKTGFNNAWGSHDGTACNTVVVDNCVFKNSRAGVGTHVGPENGFHQNITIQNSTFDSVGANFDGKYTSPIRMSKWKNVLIRNNKFTNCKGYNIYATGLDGTLDISGNRFDQELSISSIAEYGLSNIHDNTLNGTPYEYYYDDNWELPDVEE